MTSYQQGVWHFLLNQSPDNNIKTVIFTVNKAHSQRLGELATQLIASSHWEACSQCFCLKFWSKYNHFHSRKCNWKCCLQNGSHLKNQEAEALSWNHAAVHIHTSDMFKALLTCNGLVALWAHSNSKRHIKLSFFFLFHIEGHIKLG